METKVFKDKFLPVTSDLEFKKIWSDLGSPHASLTLKGTDGGLAYLKPQGYDEKGIFGNLDLTAHSLSTNQKVLVHAGLNKNEYFFESQVTRVNSKDILLKPETIFRLNQNRSQRVVIPEQMDHHVNLVSINKSPVFIDCHCLNLSSGGASLITVAQVEFSVGDQLITSFHFRRGWNIEIRSTLRHLRRRDRSQKLVFGIQFEKLVPSLQAQLDLMIVKIMKASFDESRRKKP